MIDGDHFDQLASYCDVIGTVRTVSLSLNSLGLLIPTALRSGTTIFSGYLLRAGEQIGEEDGVYQPYFTLRDECAYYQCT